MQKSEHGKKPGLLLGSRTGAGTAVSQSGFLFSREDDTQAIHLAHIPDAFIYPFSTDASGIVMDARGKSTGVGPCPQGVLSLVRATKKQPKRTIRRSVHTRTRL